jgi:hypothetical protein
VANLSVFGARYGAFNSLFAPRLTGPDSRPRESVSVPTTSIDSYVARTQTIPNLVKIDAESSESRVIEGMRNTIERFRPIITLEVGDMGVRGAPLSRELIATVVALRYSVVEWSGTDFRRHVIKSDYSYQNLVFLPG